MKTSDFLPAYEYCHPNVLSFLSGSDPPPIPEKHKSQSQVQMRSSSVISDRSNRHTTIIGGQTVQQILSGQDQSRNRNSLVASAEVLF